MLIELEYILGGQVRRIEVAVEPIPVSFSERRKASHMASLLLIAVGEHFSRHRAGMMRALWLKTAFCRSSG
jgi:hypothetical protein